MTPAIRRQAAWCVLLAAAVAAAPAGAQETPEDAVARAVQLQDSGRWMDGREMLLRQLAQCPGTTEPGPCRLLLSRALGYAHQRQAQRDPRERQPLLERAAYYYNGALKEAPGDGASLTNLALAYRAMGRDAELEALLRRAADLDTSGTAFYALMLGDFYERHEAWNDARAAYARAIAAAPDQETPRRRLVDMYAHLPRDSAANLFRIVSTSPDWEARFPDATLRAYELAVSRLSDRGIARSACYRWVTLLAETQLLTVERLDAIGASWLAPDLGALEAFVASPVSPPTTGIWAQFDGRETVARAALALGRRQLAAGDPKGAEAYFSEGMKVGLGAAPATLDVAVELAAFYDAHPDFDPTSSKFKAMENLLFRGKAEAYYRADREAIQRFHSVLGLIYAQRGTWRSSDAPWTNAVYQLEHALETARSRDQAEGSYQPLPQLRALLAEGYVANDRRPQARAMYVEAAQAFLDLDQLPQASQVLERGKSLSGLAPERRIQALDDVIRARGEATDRAVRPAAERCDSDAEAIDRSARSAGLGDAFAQRQRFKVLADCLLAGPAPVRPADAARVLTDAVTKRVPLVGVGDFLRIQQSQAVVNQKLRRAGATQRPQLDQSKVPPQGPALRFQLPNEARATYLAVDPDVLVGAGALQQIGDNPAITSIGVSRGKVTVAAGDLSTADRSTLQARLGPNAVIHAAAKVPPPPPPLSDSAALSAVVEQYARAIESRDLAAMRRVVGEFDAPKFEAFFRRADSLHAHLDVADVQVHGESAQAFVRGVFRYRDRKTREPRQDRVTQRARFVRLKDGWRMLSIQ